jgi:UDP-N-acetylglucosamine--N-acetylmuramyl-(pentapeptide) pyrophosphoryl-undecaprenol N-acetylglucosamine transferase
MATGRPSLLIPFAAAQDDHQTLNGRIISQGKAGWVIPEDQISQEGVADKIAYLMTHPSELRAAAVAARALWIPEAAEKVADLVEGLKS